MFGEGVLVQMSGSCVVSRGPSHRKLYLSTEHSEPKASNPVQDSGGR